MKRVLLVDDHKIIRDGLRALLRNDNEIKIIGECEDGDEVEDFIKKHKTDVILMDINMKRKNGIEATRELTEKYPNIKILILTMHNEEVYITKVLKSGAMGYVLKNTGKTELVNAIRAVYDGKNFFSDEVSETIMARLLKKNMDEEEEGFKITPDQLTSREIEILQLVAEEYTSIEIGEQLEISPRTVDSHRRTLLAKIGVKNTVGLIKYVYHYKLLVQ